MSVHWERLYVVSEMVILDRVWLSPRVQSLSRANIKELPACIVGLAFEIA